MGLWSFPKRGQASSEDAVDRLDLDVEFEFQRLQYNRYCDTLRTRARLLTGSLAAIERLQCKNRMVRAELAFRIRGRSLV